MSDELEKLSSAASPGEYRSCRGAGRGHCSCGQIWSLEDDRIVAIATHISQYTPETVEWDSAKELVYHSAEVTDANAKFLATLVNAYRSGDLAPAANTARVRAERDMLAEELRNLMDKADDWRANATVDLADAIGKCRAALSHLDADRDER